jgi:hypothetical protein
MVMIPEGLGSENYCAGEAQQQLYTTDSPSRQIGHNTSRIPQLSDNNNNVVMGPRGVPDTKSDWGTDPRS